LSQSAIEHDNSEKQEDTDFKVGRLGELLVEQKLIENGWHSVRLDTAQFAANADLIAVNRSRRVLLQVKTTNAMRKHAHSHCIGFGYATNYLRNGGSIFNSKVSPLIADVVVGVHYNSLSSRYVVLPIGFAENLCNTQVDWWHKVPLKRGGQRTTNFPMYICFTKIPGVHVEMHTKLMNNLLRFENAWHLLGESPDKLRDPEFWPLIDR
jgi:hypothetical protein